MGSPDRLVIGLTGYRPGTTWTVALRRGSCASVGTLVLSVRVTASATGRLARTVILTTAQTRAAKLPLTLRAGRCAAFAAPVIAPPVVVPGTFGAGTWRLGGAVVPGTYRSANVGDSCYWARLSGFGGTMAEIIANEIGAGPQLATIAATDAGFTSSRCGTWRLDAPAVVTASPGNGTWRVGTDIAPGTYQTPGVVDSSCYWARLSGFGGTMAEVITNDMAAGPMIVTILPTDVGFKSSRCGTWTLIP